MAIQYVKYVCSVSVPVSVSVPAHSCKTTRSTYLAVENIHIFICPEASKWLWSKPFYRMPRKRETVWNLVNHTLKHSPRVNNNKIYEKCATQAKAHRFRFFVPACAYEKSVHRIEMQQAYINLHPPRAHHITCSFEGYGAKWPSAQNSDPRLLARRDFSERFNQKQPRHRPLRALRPNGLRAV